MAKPRGRPFQPGNHAGKGRPRGSRNQANQIAQQLIDSWAESITKKCIAMALQGDRAALRACMERILPPCQERPVKLKLPAAGSAGEVSHVLRVVVDAISKGKLTPGEGQQLADVVEHWRCTLETAEYETRLKALEERLLGEE